MRSWCPALLTHSCPVADVRRLFGVHLHADDEPTFRRVLQRQANSPLARLPDFFDDCDRLTAMCARRTDLDPALDRTGLPPKHLGECLIARVLSPRFRPQRLAKAATILSRI